MQIPGYSLSCNLRDSNFLSCNLQSKGLLSCRAVHMIGTSYRAICGVAVCYRAICRIGISYRAICKVGACYRAICIIRISYCAICKVGACYRTMCKIGFWNVNNARLIVRKSYLWWFTNLAGGDLVGTNGIEKDLVHGPPGLVWGKGLAWLSVSEVLIWLGRETEGLVLIFLSFAWL